MDDSPFGKLSPELRNKIYGFALIFKDTPLHVTADHYNAKLHTTRECAELQPVALTAVCRQIHKETNQMLYHFNTFVIHFLHSVPEKSRDEACLLQRFCASLGESNVASLRRITVTLVRDNFISDLPERFADMRHQLLKLRAVSLSIPNCELLCSFCWEDSTKLDRHRIQLSDSVLLPLVQFRVEAGTASLSRAVAQLEKEITRFQQSGGATYEHFIDLLELLRKLITDPSLGQDSCYWEMECNRSVERFSVSSRYITEG